MVTAAGLESRGGAAALGALATPGAAGAANAPGAPNAAAVTGWSPRRKQDSKSAAKAGRGGPRTEKQRNRSGGRAGAASGHAGAQVWARARICALVCSSRPAPPEVQAGRVLEHREQPKQRTIPGSDPTHQPSTRRVRPQTEAAEATEAWTRCGLGVSDPDAERVAGQRAELRTASGATGSAGGSYHDSAS